MNNFFFFYEKNIQISHLKFNTFENKSAQVEKKKNKITLFLLVGANIDGSGKLSLLVIGNSKKKTVF